MVMGPPSPQVAPAEWLAHMLDHGPKPLAYAPEAKFAIRQHLVDLVTVRATRPHLVYRAVDPALPLKRLMISVDPCIDR